MKVKNIILHSLQGSHINIQLPLKSDYCTISIFMVTFNVLADACTKTELKLKNAKNIAHASETSTATC